MVREVCGYPPAPVWTRQVGDVLRRYVKTGQSRPTQPLAIAFKGRQPDSPPSLAGERRQSSALLRIDDALFLFGCRYWRATRNILPIYRAVMIVHRNAVVRIVAIAHVQIDRKSTRLNSSHSQISYAVFC